MDTNLYNNCTFVLCKVKFFWHCFLAYFLACPGLQKVLPHLFFIAFVPLLLLFKKIKTVGSWQFFALFFLGFLTWNAITTWWLWNATVFGMFFAMIVNALLMACVMVAWKRIDRKIRFKSWTYFCATNLGVF